MTLREILEIIEGKTITENINLDQEVKMGCGSDLMSDVLAFTHQGTVLMSGLTNPQVVRTAEIAGIQAIIFVRGKYPPQKTIDIAEEKSIPLLASKYTMFETCGRIYASGLPSCGVFDLTSHQWDAKFTGDE